MSSRLLAPYYLRAVLSSLVKRYSICHGALCPMPCFPSASIHAISSDLFDPCKTQGNANNSLLIVPFATNAGCRCYTDAPPPELPVITTISTPLPSFDLRTLNSSWVDVFTASAAKSVSWAPMSTSTKWLLRVHLPDSSFPAQTMSFTT